MRKHQRYFPVLDAAGHLLPYFVTVANGFVETSQARAPTAHVQPRRLPACGSSGARAT